MTRQCNSCKCVLPLSAFDKRKHYREDRYVERSQCKACRSLQHKEHRETNRARLATLTLDNASSSKRCATCHGMFPRQDFYKDTVRPDGLTLHCKSCTNERITTAAHAQATRREAQALVTPVDPEATYKTCPHCQSEQPYSAFHISRRNHDGLSTYCKACCAHKHQQRVLTNQARLATQALDVQTTFKVCSHCHRSKPLDAFHRDRSQTDGRNIFCKACRRQVCTRWLDKGDNRVRNNLGTLARLKEHPERGRMAAAKRRARKLGLPDTLTTDDVVFCYQYWGFCCAICGEEEGLFGMKLVLDHWLPLASAHSLGTVPDNMVLLCDGKQGCNTSKNDILPTDWLTRRYRPRKARQILARVEAYFAVVRSRERDSLSISMA